MYRKRKRCFLCDRLINYNRAACSDHAAIYKEYKDHLWCIELVAAENRQGYIESKETTAIDSLNSNVLLQLQTDVLPNKKQIDKELIINLYVNGMKPMQITNQLNLKYKTVKSIIYHFMRAQKQ